MPLFQIGYRQYEGERTPRWRRWWPITRAGVTIAWRSKLLRRLVYVSFLPFLYFGWVFFVIGRVTDPGTASPSAPFHEIVRQILGPELSRQLQEDPSAVRTAVWAVVFASYGAYFQLLVAGLVAAIVGPRLVADDLRSRAFLIYFARPLSRLDYVVGKAGVLVALLGAVTLVPSVVLYAASILFSPSLDAIAQTLPVLVSVVLATLGTILPAALVMLVLSSLTKQPRFAAATWVVVCLFGPIVHEVLQQTKGLRDAGWTFLASLPHTVRALQLGLYDVDGRVSALDLRHADMRDFVEGLETANSPTLAGVWLLFLCALGVGILLRRVDAPTRV